MTESWQSQTDSKQLFEVLRQGARTHLSKEKSEQFTQIVRQTRDWTRLLEAARGHGVAPLVAWQLLVVAREVLPPSALLSCRAELQQVAACNVLAAQELVTLAGRCQHAGIPILPFKGPVLAQAAYGNLALRTFLDLDVLVFQRDVHRVVQFLFDQGYRTPAEWTRNQTEFHLKTLGQLPLINPQGLAVEVHTTVLPPAFGFPLFMQGMWERRGRLVLLGQEISVPAPEDHLVLLCAHGAKHLWTRLTWICDIAELVRSAPTISWAATFEVARRTHARRMLDLGLLLAHRLFDVPLPVQVTASSAASIGVLSRNIERCLVDPASSPGGALHHCVFYCRSRERVWDALRYCISLIVTPTESDWCVIPGVVSARLYYLVRPVRLGIKYLRELVQRR